MHIFSITEENCWCFKSCEILIRLLLFIFLSYYCFPVEMLWTRLDLLYIVVYHPSKDFFQAYVVTRIGIKKNLHVWSLLMTIEQWVLPHVTQDLASYGFNRRIHPIHTDNGIATTNISKKMQKNGIFNFI